MKNQNAKNLNIELNLKTAAILRTYLKQLEKFVDQLEEIETAPEDLTVQEAAALADYFKNDLKKYYQLTSHLSQIDDILENENENY